MNRVPHLLLIAILVAIGLRAVASIVSPVLPALIVVLVLVVVVSRLFGGPRAGGFGFKR